MAMQRRGKSWFEISKVVIDDYGRKIGAHGVAVYACLARMCQGNEDGQGFEIDDIGAMLGIEKAEAAQALDRLLQAGVLRHGIRDNGDGTTSECYDLVNFHPQYYGWTLLTRPEPEIQHIPVKKAPGRKGLVYVVEGEGYFKIGCTTNFAERIKALSVKAPFAMIVHLVIPSLDMYATEQELHRRFATKHRRGEWFNLERQDIEDIRNDYPGLDPAFLATE